MAFGKISNVVIYDESLYKPGATVWRWVGKATRRFSKEAKIAAPMRTGELKRKIHATTPRSGYKVVRGFIRSDAPHSLAVIHGTGPWIYGHGKGMRVPATRGILRGADLPDEAVHIRKKVRGQEANNFMFVAWRRTARAHPAVGGAGLPSVLGG